MGQEGRGPTYGLAWPVEDQSRERGAGGRPRPRRVMAKERAYGRVPPPGCQSDVLRSDRISFSLLLPCFWITADHPGRGRGGPGCAALDLSHSFLEDGWQWMGPPNLREGEGGGIEWDRLGVEKEPKGRIPWCTSERGVGDEGEDEESNMEIKKGWMGSRSP